MVQIDKEEFDSSEIEIVPLEAIPPKTLECLSRRGQMLNDRVFHLETFATILSPGTAQFASRMRQFLERTGSTNELQTEAHVCKSHKACKSDQNNG